MPKLIPKEKINKIIFLRRHGYSISEIYKNVKVGYGTICRYIKGVEILPEYKEIWLSKRNGSLKRKKIEEEKAWKKALKELTSLSKKEKLILLSALYWAEGNKKDFIITNTDSDLISIFVKGLIDIFKIKKSDIKISIRIFEDLDKETCLNYWSKVTNIKKDDFLKTTILKGKKKGKLNYGMCRVRVRKGGFLLKYILACKDRIKELFMSP